MVSCVGRVSRPAVGLPLDCRWNSGGLIWACPGTVGPVKLAPRNTSKPQAPPKSEVRWRSAALAPPAGGKQVGGVKQIDKAGRGMWRGSARTLNPGQVSAARTRLTCPVQAWRACRNGPYVRSCTRGRVCMRLRLARLAGHWE
eukprot:9472796-Pyramimonas_sp.AAC.2